MIFILEYFGKVELTIYLILQSLQMHIIHRLQAKHHLMEPTLRRRHLHTRRHLPQLAVSIRPDIKAVII